MQFLLLVFQDGKLPKPVVFFFSSDSCRWICPPFFLSPHLPASPNLGKSLEGSFLSIPSSLFPGDPSIEMNALQAAF